MTVHPVTVNLSEPLYRRIQRAAERTQRSMEQLLGDAAAALTPENSNLPADLQTAMTYPIRISSSRASRNQTR